MLAMVDLDLELVQELEQARVPALVQVLPELELELELVVQLFLVVLLATAHLLVNPVLREVPTAILNMSYVILQPPPLTP